MIRGLNVQELATVETLVLMDSIGQDLINKNKLYITYGCRHYKEA